jgi:hypothetical protein
LGVNVNTEVSIELRRAVMRPHRIGTCENRVRVGMFGTKGKEETGEVRTV